MLDRSRCLNPADSTLDLAPSPSVRLRVAAILLGCLIGAGCTGQPTATTQPDPANVDLLIKDIENRPWE